MCIRDSISCIILNRLNSCMLILIVLDHLQTLKWWFKKIRSVRGIALLGQSDQASAFYPVLLQPVASQQQLLVILIQPSIIVKISTFEDRLLDNGFSVFVLLMICL